MDFRTIVNIPSARWQLTPCERMLFIGSCFADNLGHRFSEEKFRTMVNPFGVMYNPASILHTVERLAATNALPFSKTEPGTAVFTLGTNHVYILKETGEIVDNCQKRPQRLFNEQLLNVSECADYLVRAIRLIHEHYPQVNVLLTVSPIRYRKYGYHGSRLSKATLLLAVEEVIDTINRTQEKGGIPTGCTDYFPSYEIMNDELRDYRFYAPDMLHPSDQAVDYIWERLGEVYFTKATVEFLKAWKPLREALAHKPFHPESTEYKNFMEKTLKGIKKLKEQYPMME